MAAFEWLGEQTSRYGDVLPRTLLAEGFRIDGVRVPLLGPQGIFKPQVMSDVPLSVTTAPTMIRSARMDCCAIVTAEPTYSMPTTAGFAARWGVDSLTNNTSGAAYPAVTAETFEKADLLIPSAVLLKEFGNATEPIAEQIHTLHRQSPTCLSRNPPEASQRG